MLSLSYLSGMTVFIILSGQKEEKQLYESISFRMLYSSWNYLTLSHGIYDFLKRENIYVPLDHTDRL